MKDFNFMHTWNQSLLKREERPIEPRAHIYASELGGSPIDIYLSLKGELPTNLPNERSLRKFCAGNFFEDLVRLILARAGVLIDRQQRIEHAYEGLLRVSGRQDFIVGGVPDFFKAEEDIHRLKDAMSHFAYQASLDIIEDLKKQDIKEIKETVVEIKSCSSMMFSRYQMTGAAPQHKLQTFHYLKGLGKEEGKIVYISKDDMLLLECQVLNPSKVEDDYKAFIQKITDYYNANELPPKEPLIIFDATGLKFSKNWRVEYSKFLSKLYNFTQPEDYRMFVDKSIAQFNRTYQRCILGKKMTPLNLTTIQEAKKWFPNFEELIEIGKEHKDLIVEEEEV